MLQIIYKYVTACVIYVISYKQEKAIIMFFLMNCNIQKNNQFIIMIDKKAIPMES